MHSYKHTYMRIIVSAQMDYSNMDTLCNLHYDPRGHSKWKRMMVCRITALIHFHYMTENPGIDISFSA